MVSIIMGSRSDLEVMREAVDMMSEFGIAHELVVVSAHRTPERMFEFGRTAAQRGVKVIIAGAGGADACAQDAIGIGKRAAPVGIHQLAVRDGPHLVGRVVAFAETERRVVHGGPEA